MSMKHKRNLNNLLRLSDISAKLNIESSQLTIKSNKIKN